jgi:hypothetical protein
MERCIIDSDMIYTVLLFSYAGIGHAFSNNSNKYKEIELTSCFLSALQTFARELKEEVQSIKFVRSRIVFLPSQQLYTIALHTSLDENENDAFEILESIRDEINITLNEHIYREGFFNDNTDINQRLTPILEKVLNWSVSSNAGSN